MFFNIVRLIRIPETFLFSQVEKHLLDGPLEDTTLIVVSEIEGVVVPPILKFMILMVENLELLVEVLSDIVEEIKQEGLIPDGRVSKW